MAVDDDRMWYLGSKRIGQHAGARRRRRTWSPGTASCFGIDCISIALFLTPVTHLLYAGYYRVTVGSSIGATTGTESSVLSGVRPVGAAHSFKSFLGGIAVSVATLHLAPLAELPHDVIVVEGSRYVD